MIHVVDIYRDINICGLYAGVDIVCHTDGSYAGLIYSNHTGGLYTEVVIQHISCVGY